MHQQTQIERNNDGGFGTCVESRNHFCIVHTYPGSERPISSPITDLVHTYEKRFSLPFGPSDSTLAGTVADGIQIWKGKVTTLLVATFYQCEIPL
jgi:hypothetical protein